MKLKQNNQVYSADSLKVSVANIEFIVFHLVKLKIFPNMKVCVS